MPFAALLALSRACSTTHPGSRRTGGSRSAEGGSSPWARGGRAGLPGLGHTRVRSAASG